MIKLRKLVVRVFVSILILYSGFLVLRQYNDLKIINENFKLEESVKIKLNNWSSNFLHIDYDFDNDKKFNEEIKKILEKRADDPDFWPVVKTKKNSLPLSVEFPQFYLDPSIKKTAFQPFDPRFTLSVYFKWIEEHPKEPVQFHWSDWVDLSNLEKFLINNDKELRVKCENLFDISNNEDLIKDSTIKPVKEYCKNYFDTLLGYKITASPGEQTVENLEIIGKSYLFTDFEPPTKLVILSDKGNSEVHVGHRDSDLKHALLNNQYVEKLYGTQEPKPVEETGDAEKQAEVPGKATEAAGDAAKEAKEGETSPQMGPEIGPELEPTAETMAGPEAPKTASVTKRDDKKVSVNVLDSFTSMIEKVKVTSPVPEVHDVIVIGKNLFEFDAKAKIKELESLDKPSLNQRMYLESLKNSVAMEDPPKYFNEAKMLKSYSDHWLGEHYDWRFFNGLTVGKTEQQISLYKMVKTYLEFCNNENLVTWLAHGSLLSWYWNGLLFPWDTDLDVQMPIQHLNKLAEHFNQSLVLENVNKHGKFNGMGKYFIDVGSSITYREKGNGNNNIDARFIDVDTGLYVDITGLAVTNTGAPSKYNYLTPDFVETTGLENLKKNQKFGFANCRNNHFVKVDEVDHLYPIHFQDQLTYLSNNFLRMINDEYDLNSITDKNYRDYIYLNNFRIWTNTQNILDYINDPKGWLSKQTGQDDHPTVKRVIGTYEKLQINKLTYQDYLNLLQDKSILKDYLMNKVYTLNHEQELKSLIYNKHNKFEIIKTSYMIDLFLNKIYENDWNYEKEVERIIDLTNVQ